MTHQKLEYEAIIRSHGGRVTPQRVLILDAICAGEGHTTFGEILTRVKLTDPSIDRSTLYRALDFFEEVGLVVSAEIGKGEKVYEIARQKPHHHLVCQSCGREIEIGQQTMRQVFDIFQRQHHFQIGMKHIVLLGLCEDCQSGETESPGPM
jgi:Fur family ferric uptake transcriptional regulator